MTIDEVTTAGEFDRIVQALVNKELEATLRSPIPLVTTAGKTPSGGSSIPCTCAEQIAVNGVEEHTHEYSQTGSGTCAFAGCACDWSLGAMMIAEDDPLRDTPEKAELYARRIKALLAEKDRAEEAVAANEGVIAIEKRLRDKEAALRLLGMGPSPTIEPEGAEFDPDAGVPEEIKRLREAQAAASKRGWVPYGQGEAKPFA